MTTPRTLPAGHGRRAAAMAFCWLVAVAPILDVRAEEPGPVPLLDEAAPVAREQSKPRAAPAGLGDWRFVAALGAAFVVLVAARMASGRRASPPPPDVFEVLGTASLGGQHAVRIVRFGPKTLLVGVSAAGATTLAEIGDPHATASIAAACRGLPPPRAARGAAPSPHDAPPADPGGRRPLESRQVVADRSAGPAGDPRPAHSTPSGPVRGVAAGEAA